MVASSGLRWQAVCAIFERADPGQRAAFVQWLGVFGRSAKVPYRTMALDVAAAVLAAPVPASAGGANAPASPATSAPLASLFDLIQSRVHDKMPRSAGRACPDPLAGHGTLIGARCTERVGLGPVLSVRARALAALLSLLTDSVANAPWASAFVNAILTDASRTRPSLQPLPAPRWDAHAKVGFRCTATGPLAWLPRRVADEKSVVRKGALQVRPRRRQERGAHGMRLLLTTH